MCDELRNVEQEIKVEKGRISAFNRQTSASPDSAAS
jgi:hypothetical protein